uniref:G_PROTEIN_RECEP_F1_2 domain-containing protein n=1 Tax=Caenorhabditis japonica TaxID=281687 RepID=A0A8R1DYP0_CAEJA
MNHIDYIVHVIVMPIVLSIGMINQCLNVCTLLHIRTSIFLYLKASAIADILSIFAFIPFLLRHANLIDLTWETGMLYHAHFELPLINALISASALNIVAMTVDRYVSVCHPIKFFQNNETKPSRRRTMLIIVLIYFTALMIYFPSVFQKKVGVVVDASMNETIYTIVRNEEVEAMQVFRFYLILRECICRWGPVLLLVILNMCVVRGLRKLDKRNWFWRQPSTTSRYENCAQRQNRTPRDDRSRISVLLFVTSATFIICNIPASVISFFIGRVSGSMFWQIFRAIANLLQVTSYLYNFYLYALCSSEYRHAFLRLFGCRSSPTPTSTGDSPTVRVSVHGKRCQAVVLLGNEQQESPVDDV